MATNRVFIKYSETYDLNTVQDKLSVIAVHTPSNLTLLRMARGLFMNFKKYKIHGCNLAIACASQMPVDPLGVGTEPGMVAPQDLMNPMLFKACTGDGLNKLLDVIYENNVNNVLPNPSITEHKIDTVTDYDPLQIYYTLLADESWRKAIPQMGMIVNGLKPLVHDLATLRPMTWGRRMPNIKLANGMDYPMGGYSSDGVVNVPFPDGTGAGDSEQGVVLSGSMYHFGSNLDAADGNFATSLNPVEFISTGTRPLPALDTLISYSDVESNIFVPVVPRVYCGVLVMPPAVLQSLYFRVRITWDIEFMGFRPYTDGLNPDGMSDSADLFYQNMIIPAGSGDTEVAQAMTLKNGSIDGIGLDNLEVVNASMR